MTLDDDLPPILTVDQAATVLGISRGLAFTAARTGQIPTVRIGRRILVPRDRLRALLDSRGNDRYELDHERAPACPPGQAEPGGRGRARATTRRPGPARPAPDTKRSPR